MPRSPQSFLRDIRPSALRSPELRDRARHRPTGARGSGSRRTRGATGGSKLSELFSHSRLASFDDCPKKFEYRYVLKIPRKTESIEGFVGKRVHEVLERLYIATGKGRLPTLRQVLHRYGALFDEHHDPRRVRIVRTETPLEEYRANGERSLTNYYRKHYPFDADETLGLEERIRFDLDDEGRYGIQGFVDRIARARDGAIEIHDYKTGRWVPDQAQIDADRQLALYQIGVMKRYGDDEPVRLVWHYLLRDQVRRSTRTREQLASLRADTMAQIDLIRAETRYEPKPSALCAWCEYNDICPANPAKRPGVAADGGKAATASAQLGTPAGDASSLGAAEPTASPVGNDGAPSRSGGQLSLL